MRKTAASALSIALWLALGPAARAQDVELESRALEVESLDPSELLDRGDLVPDEAREALRDELEVHGETEIAEAEPTSLPTGGDRSAVAPSRISLPDGEGSIEGLGESFSASLVTGALSFTLPIALPPGRNGTAPPLALGYSSGGRSGEAGYGWALSVAAISRQSDRGLPRYDDRPRWHPGEDRFVYAGSHELVPVDSDDAAQLDGGRIPAELAGWQQYRAQVEGSFMRFFRAPDATRWVVQAPDGTRYDLGLLPAGEGPSEAIASSEHALLRSPDGQRIASWGLTRTTDVHGSTVYYVYEGEARDLSAVYYVSPASCAASGSDAVSRRRCSAPLSDYGVRVRIVYEARPDATVSYRTGWRIESARRIRRIEVSAASTSVGSRYLVRRVHLAYDPRSYHSQLASVTIEGRPESTHPSYGVQVAQLIAESSLGDAIVGPTLPPMRLRYTGDDALARGVDGFPALDSTRRQGASSPAHGVGDLRSDLFDVNSDGLPDLIVTEPGRFRTADGAPAVGVYFNGFAGASARPASAGTFSSAIAVAAPNGLAGVMQLSNPNVVPMDVDGDGRSDLLHMPRVRSYGYFAPVRASGAQTSPAAQGWRFAHLPVELPDDALDPRIDLGRDGERIRVMDVNDDSLVDVVRTSGDAIQTWLNLGYVLGGEGLFGSANHDGTRWVLSQDPIESCLPVAAGALSFDDPEVRLADMNGDGLEDVVRLSPGAVVWLPNRGWGRFGEGEGDCPAGIAGARWIEMRAPRDLGAAFDATYLADVDGDGASDLVRVGQGVLDVWFNMGGRAFSRPATIEGLRWNRDLDRVVRLVDVDGSGTVDVLFASARRWEWVDPMGGRRHRLLREVEAGLGALTRFEYGTTAEDYLRDLAAAEGCSGPGCERFLWQGRDDGGCDARVLGASGECVVRSTGTPVVTTVVRATTTSDRLDVLGVPAQVSRAEYAYHDGYYEGIEQELRGFGATDLRTVGDASQPTSIARTRMHQGRRPRSIAGDRRAENPWEALKGATYLGETWEESSGRFLSTVHTSHRVRRLLVGLDGREVTWAFPARTDTILYDTSTTWTPAAPGTRAPFAGGSDGDDYPVVAREIVADGEVVADVDHPGWSEPVWLRSAGFYAITASTTDRVDHIGHVIERTAWGRVRSEYGEPLGAEEIVTHTIPMLLEPERWIWRTSETWTSGHGSSERLGHTAQLYERGSVLPTRTYSSVTIPRAYEFAGDADGSQSFTQSAQTLQTTLRYDAWGNVTYTCEGGQIEVSQSTCLRFSLAEYDDAYAHVLASERIYTDRDASGFTGMMLSRVAIDRGLGVATQVIDPAGRIADAGYDGFGRVTWVRPPDVRGCEGDARPQVRNHYRLTTDPLGSPISVLESIQEVGCRAALGAGALVSRSYVDGLGRERAVLSRADAPHAWVRTGLVSLTPQGQPARSWDAAFLGVAEPTVAQVLARTGEEGESQTGYDAFGRVRWSLPLGGTWGERTWTTYGALVVNVCDPNHVDPEHFAYGACTTIRSDGHGRTVDTILRQRRSEGAPFETYRLWLTRRADGAVLAIERAQTPDRTPLPLARAQVLPGRHVTRTFAVDSAGRRIASTDRDTDARRAGTTEANRSWRYLYNRVGDLVAVRDPRGCGQNFYYDRGGRLLGEDYVSCGEAEPWRDRSNETVPAGAIALDPIAAPQRVEVRAHYDAYPAWAIGALAPPSWAGAARGLVTATVDRGARSVVAYDARGLATWSARQMALLPEAEPAPSTLDGALPSVIASAPLATPPLRAFDAAHTYVAESRHDHGGRPMSRTLPDDPDLDDARGPIGGRIEYDVRGLPSAVALRIGATERAIITQATYDAGGRLLETIWGDDAGGTRAPTVSETIYDRRRRPRRVSVVRAPTRAPSAARALAEVSVVHDQTFDWDAVDNLLAITDGRVGREWPDGFRPQSVRLRHDALYRVIDAEYSYRADDASGAEDAATDYRDALRALEGADPMRELPAPSVAGALDSRVVSLTWDHDFLGNTVEWSDDQHAFHERSLDRISNGIDEAGDRPSAIRLAASITTSPHPYDASADRGGWLEVDYGDSGNVTAVTVHGQCRDASALAVCIDAGGSVQSRRDALRSACSCGVEQHYQYRHDELSQIVDARRYDRAGAGSWSLAAHLRYAFDGAQERTVKEVRDTLGQARYAIWPYPGDYERRGLARGPDTYAATEGTETQYLVGGARVVWQDGAIASGLDADHRITLAIPDLLGTSSAVIDLASGELVEASTYYPNGARETVRTSDRGDLPLEPMGFTGKEADEEVGLVYFGMRFLMPRLGRWATPDPLQIHAEGGGEALNNYHYVRGSLLQARDPVGLDSADEVDEIVQAVADWAEIEGAAYDGTSATGTRLHKILQTDLPGRVANNPRLITEAIIDANGVVVAHGVGPEHVMRLPGGSTRGTYRTVDVLVVDDFVSDADVRRIRAGKISAHGKVIPIDYKFGGAHMRRATHDEIVRRLGSNTLAVGEGGLFRRATRRASSSASSASGGGSSLLPQARVIRGAGGSRWARWARRGLRVSRAAGPVLQVVSGVDYLQSLDACEDADCVKYRAADYWTMGASSVVLDGMWAAQELGNYYGSRMLDDMDRAMYEGMTGDSYDDAVENGEMESNWQPSENPFDKWRW
ncbi:SpvB/TcaC N-terminal domain-containing protein [Sandaracinus amylolyticus]|uniref:SpvB/TcaC N-terminal domain-containing protein n=1 Tax=Sandaracinus amylolyticus TaxID=927083 RepID=UPI001F44AF42|nr:SpvB/TcaC N-terminal domain-containing protein [Sandaracinus amylolyticus]UJR84230.1 Hypothetical protein I5071_63020 [Sandaracinus amylolyticus]